MLEDDDLRKTVATVDNDQLEETRCCDICKERAWAVETGPANQS